MTEWTGSPEEAMSAIGQIEAGAVNYKDLRELAGALKMEIPAQLSKPNLSALLLERLRGMWTASDPEPAPGMGQPASVPAHPSLPADLLLDEDLDIVAVYPKGDHKPVISRRLKGVRGQLAAKIVCDVQDLAEAEGYVVKRRMRRISGTDYGM